MNKATTSRPPKAAVAAKIDLPKLAKGEVYIGGHIAPDGQITHTILLPFEKASLQWNDALAWAKEHGGDLPTRLEQSMLWAHHRKLFKKGWYWSNEQYAGNAAAAWLQSFSGGSQYGWRKACKDMARAVRRVTI